MRDRERSFNSKNLLNGLERISIYDVFTRYDTLIETSLLAHY